MNIAVCGAFAAMCLFYLTFQHMKARPDSGKAGQIVVKCGATAMAALVALLGCLQNGAPAHWTLLAGLIACTIADGVLCVHIIAGGAVFALGHALYMAAFCMMRRPDGRCLLLFLCLMGMISAGVMWFRSRIGRAYPLALAYGAVLCLMVSMAAIQLPLYFAGALLFAVSDGILGFLMMEPGHKALDYVSLGAYYLGQFLLGLAVYVS